MSDPIVPEFNKSLLGKMGLSPHDDQADKEYPTLMNLLYPRFNDRKKLIREAGSFRCAVDGPLFRIGVECPTEGIQTILATATLMDLLTLIEMHVSDPAAVWTPTYNSKKRARRGLDKSLE